MAEDVWLKCEREYFARTEYVEMDVPEKKLNKILEKYNIFLQGALIGESPFVAEDFKLTLLKGGGAVGTSKED